MLMRRHTDKIIYGGSIQITREQSKCLPEMKTIAHINVKYQPEKKIKIYYHLKICLCSEKIKKN